MIEETGIALDKKERFETKCFNEIIIMCFSKILLIYKYGHYKKFLT